jgi:hypothetical protein
MPSDDLYKRLSAADCERDNILAAIADRKLEEDARLYDWAKPYWEKRQSRRAKEREQHLKHSIPPGPWDTDLDNYHQDEYVVDLEDGYQAVLRRNVYWSWNGYVRLPEGHCAIGLDYNVFGYDHPDDVPLSPMEITYGYGSEFGFDHAAWGHSWPYRNYSPVAYGYNAGSSHDYLDYQYTLKQCKELADYFRLIQAQHSTAFGH